MPEKASSRTLREIRRITFQIAAGDIIEQEYHIAIMPETYAVDHPGRVNVTQTRGGAWVDNFGLGIGTLMMAGTTGFKETPNINTSVFSSATVDGFERWEGLRDFFRDFFNKQTANPSTPHYVNVLNWTQEDYYRTVPMGLPKLQRNVAQPLLFRYEMVFQILAPLNRLTYDQKVDDILANLSTLTRLAQAIAGRMGEKLNDQWATILLDIRNSTVLPDLTDDAKASFIDSYVGNVLQRNSPAAFVPLTDSKDGIGARTLTLSRRIQEFTDGRARFINTTLGEVQTIARGWRDVINAVDFALNIPASYARDVRETLCTVQSMLRYPQLFRTTVLGTLTDLNDLLEDSGCASTLNV